MKLALERVQTPYGFEVSNGKTTCSIDASESIGGNNRGLRPMELVASGLAGCIAIDVLRILEKQRVNTELFKIEINAERRAGTPAPFEYILLTFEVDESIDKSKLDKNIQLVTEKYCSVAASLDQGIIIESKIK
ncbi:MAG: OsmC family protein [Crocinitomicaceae bacterium]|nr:OsmC family protein [Crocinitomicaceae bacterium]